VKSYPTRPLAPGESVTTGVEIGEILYEGNLSSVSTMTLQASTIKITLPSPLEQFTDVSVEIDTFSFIDASGFLFKGLAPGDYEFSVLSPQYAYSSVPAARHTCLAGVCAVDVASGYYEKDVSEVRRIATVQKPAAPPTIYSVLMVSTRVCIVPFGSALYESPEVYEGSPPYGDIPALIEHPAIALSLESQRLFAAHCILPELHVGTNYIFNMSHRSLDDFALGLSPSQELISISSQLYTDFVSYWHDSNRVSWEAFSQKEQFAKAKLREIRFSPSMEEQIYLVPVWAWVHPTDPARMYTGQAITVLSGTDD